MTTPPEPVTNVVVTSKTSVKLTRNAKGEMQWEIKLVEGSTEAEVEWLRTVAIKQHNELLAEFARNAA